MGMPGSSLQGFIMSRIVLGSKPANETRKETFNFAAQLAIGETISTATVTSAVYSGTDAAPSAVISGAATISGVTVVQLLTGGIEGNVYLLTCSVSTSAGQVLKQTGFLVIIPAGM